MLSDAVAERQFQALDAAELDGKRRSEALALRVRLRHPTTP